MNGSVRRQALAQKGVVVALILAYYAQLVFGARQISLTTDEPSHVVNGYTILTTGDLWTVPHHVHPPLVNLWSAWPLLLRPEHPDPRTLAAWGQDFGRFLRELWPLLGPVDQVGWVTRFPIMLLGVVLMALVYRWARDRSGHWGGVLALTAMAWDPAMVAHSQLSTTDLGATLSAFGVFFLLDRLLRRYTWRRLIGTGVLLGGALASKVSGLTVLPALALLLGWACLQEILRERRAFRSGEGSRNACFHAAGRWLVRGAALVAVALLVLWGMFLFESRPLPLASYLRMLAQVRGDSASRTFLHVRQWEGGRWDYFPFVFTVKTPLPFLIALGAACLVGARRGRSWLPESVGLWLYPLVYAGLAVASAINVGYRHLLPVLPFCYVAIGDLGPMLRAGSVSPIRQWSRRGLAAVLVVWYATGTLRVFPYSLAYSNELVGGPRNGYHYLADSNVDWGQSFKALRAYIDKQQIDWVWLSHNAWFDPGVYGVRYRPMPPIPEAGLFFERPYDPAPGVYAISATTLQGLVVADADTYEWFRHREPIAQPGYGLLVYRVPPRAEAPRWLAQCNAPQPPLGRDAVRQGFGRDDLREIHFDCRQSWVYPEGGRSRGWYSAYRETWQRGDSFARAQLSHARLSYQQTQSGQLPPFVLFEWDGVTPVPGQAPQEARAVPPGLPPPQVEAGQSPLLPPIELDGPLALVGYQLNNPVARGDGTKRSHEHLPAPGDVELWTWWRVTAPSGRPLSIMAHLVNAEGRPVAIADGLGVLSDQWQVDDLLVQRHRFILADDVPAGTYWPQTGAYWLDTMERWPVLRDGVPVGDALLLTPVNKEPRRGWSRLARHD